MGLKKIFSLTLLLGLLLPLQAQVIRLVAPEYPPFTTLKNGKPAGMGVDMVTRVMKSAGLFWTVEIVPNYARCLASLDDGTADGFFLGSTHPDRDKLGVFTLPIMINRWIWVTRAPESLKVADGKPQEGLRVGVLLNTNPHAWLKDHQFPVVGTPGRPESLVNMLEIDRVNALLVPELIFQEVLASTGRRPEEFRTFRHSDNPFGMYLSRTYVAKNPQMLSKINQGIRDTVPPISLTTP